MMVEIDNVSSVYSGKDGKCCCGCSGKHYYASKHVKWAGKNRGYKIKPDEVNDRMIKKVVKIINTTRPDLVKPSFISTVVGERRYTAYLKVIDLYDDLPWWRRRVENVK